MYGVYLGACIKEVVYWYLYIKWLYIGCSIYGNVFRRLYVFCHLVKYGLLYN